MKLLQEQHQLLLYGLPAHAEVISARSMGNRIGKLEVVQLWLKVAKPDGTYIYTHTRTLSHANAVPAKGELIHIKYLPQNLTAVVIT